MARTFWGSLAALVVLAACDNSEPRVLAQQTFEFQTPRPVSSPASMPAAVTPERPPVLGTRLPHDILLERMRTAPTESFRPVGTTSLVYRMDLDGDVEAAFKPRTQSDPRGALSEVAAYRVARLLHLDNVPPAALRRIPKTTLLQQMDPSHRRAAEAGVAWDSDGTALGAAIYWIPSMSNLQLERPTRMEKWTKRLKQSGWVPSREREFYRDVSAMLAFDYLVGNWDRFTGGNAQGTPDATRVFLRDHDFAFTSLLRFDRHERVYSHLRRTEKFPRSFVAALAALNERTLREELAREPLAREVPLLSDEQITEVLDRRQALVSYVVSLVDEYGEEKVFDFP